MDVESMHGHVTEIECHVNAWTARQRISIGSLVEFYILETMKVTPGWVSPSRKAHL